MKITEVTIDIVERNLDFVGSKVFQASGVTGGIVHQGILRIKTCLLYTSDAADE